MTGGPVKRQLFIWFCLLTLLITGGCVLWHSPEEDVVTLKTGEKKIFSFIVASSNAVYEWKLDGEAVPATGSKYVYTAIEDNVAYHLLTVRASSGGRDFIHSWSINDEDDVYRIRLEALEDENALQPMELDRFGGWVNAPESLGEPQPGEYFRVEKLGGSWWFVTPEGNPFVSKGVTDVNWLGPTLSPGKYQDVLIEKYGTEDAWADASKDRLLSWNFNTVGPWSSYSMSLRMPHSIIILDSAGHTQRYSPEDVVTDYWSEEFAENCTKVSTERAAPYVTDEKLIGYFLDNELVWGPDHFKTDKTLLELYMEFPWGSPGRAKALEFVRCSAGSLKAFNATWLTSISDWAQLEALPSKTFNPKTNAAKSFAEEFKIIAFNRYAETAITALKEVDPNHLILGCRFHTYPGDNLIRASAEYFDVISMAYYWETPPVAEIDAIYAGVDKPFFIEEWSFKSMDTGLLNIQMYAPRVRNQTERALAYGAYVEGFMKRPYAVGYHWYKWFNNPWRGIEDIISGDNFGLIDFNDDPYTVFTDYAGEVNRRVENWHAGKE
jgi:agarase